MGGAGGRIGWVDALRGAALCGMLVFHGAWDLHAFGLVATDPSAAPLWHAFGNGIAGLFLALSGLGLALAVRRGTPQRVMLLRLGRIALAAAAVTAATCVAAPETPIWFGILQCIVVTNAVALPLRHCRTLTLLLLAAAAALAPHLVTGPLGSAWAWTGLTGQEPATLDFRPVLPWLSAALAGMAWGQSLRGTGAAPGGGSGLAAWFGWAGRHSLAIYLGHQPVLIALLALTIGFGAPPLATPTEASSFLRECQKSCIAGGGDDQLCRSTCHCVLTTTLGKTAPSRRAWPLFPRRPTGDLGAAVALCRAGPPP